MAARKIKRASYAPPIPDRVGDQMRQRAEKKKAAFRAQQQARQRYESDPEAYGQDGGQSSYTARDRGTQPIPTRPRRVRRSGWRNRGRYNPQSKGNAIPNDTPIYRY